MDEAAFYLLAGVVRTYAPCGETPILKVFQTRDPLSVMSGITPAGQLATRTRARALTGLDSVAFLRHLYWYFDSKLLVIGMAPVSIVQRRSKTAWPMAGQK